MAGCVTRDEQEALGLLARRDVLRLGAGTCGAILSALAPGCSGRVSLCRQVPPNPFTEAGKPVLIVVKGDDLSAMLRAGINALGGLDRLLPFGSEALLKANFIAPQPYPVTTPPDVIAAVAAELGRAGFGRSTLFEAHGSELVWEFSPHSIMRKLGVVDRMQSDGIAVLAGDFLNRDQFRLVHNPRWSMASPVAVHRALYDAGVVISLPVLKRHGGARLSCALKLHFGSVAMTDRLVAHKRGNQGDLEYFDHCLVQYADAVRPQLNIVDARAILARGGPTLGGRGEVVRGINRMILCGDMVATDAYCARLMAEHDPTFSVDMIARQLKLAAAMGLGTASLDAARIVEVST